METGLMVYKAKGRYKNIGDYIQSLAAERFIRGSVKYVDREQLHAYSGGKIKLIMNGWFMHFPENWPPAPNIEPLFISFHINPEKAKELLRAKGVDYLKQWEPIGCRDTSTVQLLKEKGIKGYYSGCLTLTLKKPIQQPASKNKFYFVDQAYEAPTDIISLFRYGVTLALNFKVIKQLSKRLSSQFKNNPSKIRRWLRTAAFYKTYSTRFEDEVLLQAEYISHMVSESQFNSEEEKFDYARNLLSKYGHAQLVVTSRIHAALPALGMNTPVILVLSDYFQNKNSKKGRFEGLRNFFHILEYSNFGLKAQNGFELNEK